MNKIKVFFIIPTLYGGGAERVFSYIPKFINKDKFDVTLIVVGLEKDSTYDVSGIQVKYLNKTRILHSIFTLIKVLKTHKPEIVLSTLTDLNIVMGYLSMIFPKIKFIGRFTIVLQTENNTPTRNYKIYEKGYLSEKIIPKLYKIGYNLLDIVLCQSKDMYDNMQVNKYKIPKHKLRIINNPVGDNFELKSKKSKEKELVNFITVARLVPIKGHERILRAISKLDYNFQYIIVGDGREKNKILSLIDELDLQDKVVHIPYTNEVSKYLSECDFYLMGSYAEGFPNCLIESCAVGTPVMAFKAPGGLNEIIDNGINGFLVNNEAEFIEKLNASVSLDWNPMEIRESVYKKFNKNKISKDYESLFLEMSN